METAEITDVAVATKPSSQELIDKSPKLQGAVALMQKLPESKRQAILEAILEIGGDDEDALAFASGRTCRSLGFPP